LSESDTLLEPISDYPIEDKNGNLIEDGTEYIPMSSAGSSGGDTQNGSSVSLGATASYSFPYNQVYPNRATVIQAPDGSFWFDPNINNMSWEFRRQGSAIGYGYSPDGAGHTTFHSDIVGSGEVYVSGGITGSRDSSTFNYGSFFPVKVDLASGAITGTRFGVRIVDTQPRSGDEEVTLSLSLASITLPTFVLRASKWWPYVGKWNEDTGLPL